MNTPCFWGCGRRLLLEADKLGVNRSTERGIVTWYIREGCIRERPCGSRNNMLVDDEMRQCLEEIINENYVLTISQINGELRRRLPGKPLIHDCTVAWNLKDMLFHIKLVRPVPVDGTQLWCLYKEGKNMETGSWTMPLCTTVGRGRLSVHIDKYAASEDRTWPWP